MKNVYFLRPVGQLGPIKIGCSKEPESRLDNFTIWSPVRLEMVACVTGDHSDERALHAMFRKHHLHGEWFGASKELLALIDHCIAHGELPTLPKVLKFTNTRHVGHKRRPASAPKPREGEREEGAALRELYDTGLTLRDVSEKSGCHIQRARRLILLAGGAIRSQGPSAPIGGASDPVRAAEMRARYTAGETLQAIAADYGITRERVRQILRKIGEPSHGWLPEHRRGQHPLTKDEIEAARLYDAGTPPKELAARFGLTVSQVNSAVHRCGFAVKGTGYWLRRADDAERTTLVCRLYREGVSTDEITKRAGFNNPMQIYRYLRKGGINASRRCGLQRGALEANASAIIAAYRNGKTIAQTAALFSASPTAVDSLLKRHGAKLSREETEKRRVQAVRSANVQRRGESRTQAAA